MFVADAFIFLYSFSYVCRGETTRTIELRDGLLETKRKEMSITWRIRTMNSLSHKDIIHLREARLPGWGFDYPPCQEVIGGRGKPLSHSLHNNFPFAG